ncbi:hypothetical protein V5O48_001241 [Marasmius crinis-equi]|uniref:Glucose-methanol-choline oxidoreductase N-terminal domain-containing protein n=1 Tax=Marasmius crinis-equi TaxID=585013 RepID=A0ABR3FZN5_9AGAR
MLKQGLLLAFLTLLATSTASALPDCRESHDADYDYVVVGAGAGGGPVASRLAEHGYSVLDAGHDAHNLNTTIPLYFLRALDDPQVDLNYTVNEYPPDFRFQRNDQWYPRARALGGSTIHNALVDVIANTRPDFDGIAETFDDPSWSREHMQKTFKRMERNLYLPHNNTEHGFNGWLQTSIPSPDPKYLDDQLLALEKGLTGQVATIPDLNSPADDAAIGETIPDSTIGANHNRSSVRDRLVAVHREHSGKLVFSPDTLVTKVLLCSGKHGKPSAYGVEYAPGGALPVASNFKGKSKLKTRTVRARHEVIVSAGVFQSPQLLMLSGIGDRTQLKKHGIKPVVHLPGVGKNLQGEAPPSIRKHGADDDLPDHDEIAVIWSLKHNFTLFKGCSFGSDPEQDPCLKAWRDEGRSNLYSLGVLLEGFTFKSSPEYPYPDMMIYVAPVYFPGFVRGVADLAAEHHNAVTAVSLKAHPSSKGTVELTGSHPQDRVVINKNRFQGEPGRRDVRDLRESIKRARKIMTVPEILPFIHEEVFPGAKAQTDEEIETHVYENTFGHHACCTNAIGSEDDENAVLDGDFKVHGVGNLRVVDASSWPNVPGYFITTPTYMISEKAADVILEDNAREKQVHDSEGQVVFKDDRGGWIWPMRRSKVLEKPFGPYPASMILEEACSKPGNRIALSSVWLAYANSGEPAGLDKIEQNLSKDYKVDIYGVLTVQRAAWLTQEGQEILRRDLRDRDEELFGHDTERTRLSLNWVFSGKDRELNVYIQCEKRMPAAFLTAENYKGLVFYSEIWQKTPGEIRSGQITNISCCVTSLDVQTYEKSRNYIERWRLHAFVAQTIKSQGRDAPPLEQRKVKWIIDEMRERYNSDSAHRRIIFNPDGSDVEDAETGRTKRARKPCRLSRFECADILATHGEWFIAQQIAGTGTSSQLVNVLDLWNFCKKAKAVKRRKRGPAGERSWGREYIEEGEEETENCDDIDLERFGSTPEKINSIFKKSYKKRRIAQTLDYQADAEDDGDSAAREGDYNPQYDMEFDDGSSSAYESDFSSLDEELVAKVPWFCREPPTIEGWIYDCPDRMCSFSIDLREIRANDSKGKRKSISLYSKEMRDAVFPKISNHHEEHLHRNGAYFRVVSRCPLKARLERWPPTGQEQDTPAMVKEEDHSQ